ncbi:MAG TPA: hypothetical protein PJ997_02690 [Candidatus Paceibacterota bacterium]|nr:hypothetical protein [Candidatus Paceibacterota bacterium]HMP19219.1 hypothetical protein [Candidatus Paceibacterota bacterium]HMP85597.1 hypothetical protein [Candidatus Paceibacterota bacterium]
MSQNNNKKDNNIINNNTEQSLNIGHLSELAIFKDKSFNHIFNKTEKLSTALYMITNFMSAQEPLKWQIRDTSLKMLNSVMSLNKVSLSERDIVMREITGYLFEVKSLFGIAFRSGFISMMNFEIVDNELHRLAEFIAEYDCDKLSMNSNLFADSFWEKGTLAVDNFSDDVFGKNEKNIKDKEFDNKSKNFIKDRIVKKEAQFKKTDFAHKGQIQNKVPNFVLKDIRASDLNNQISKKAKEIKINNRRESILKIIKDLGEVSIKDIGERINDCSEKTLQRELINLVLEGVLKKEGDRRWSKYSLK